jgi:hypothetical protein
MWEEKDGNTMFRRNQFTRSHNQKDDSCEVIYVCFRVSMFGGFGRESVCFDRRIRRRFYAT